MVNTKSPDSVADATYLRKIRKPLVEKKRRDRMNNSLAQLKSLLAVNIKQSDTTAMARLDKADILELTVNHLTNLKHQHRSISLATAAESYKKGFKDCVRETFSYLSSTQALDADSLHRLNNHLHTCYTEKTKGTTSVSRNVHVHLEEVNTAHVSKRSDVYLGTDSNWTRSSFHAQSSVLTTDHDYSTCEQYYNRRDYYAKLNDSVDTSFNSSYNTSLMSLDSSSCSTPEKTVSTQGVGDNLWRPW